MRQYKLYFSILFLTACAEGTLFHCYKPLPAEGWERHDTICFELPQIERNISGTISIGLRTKAHVGKKDVVLLVEQCDDSVGVYRRDTLRCPLEDEEGNAVVGGVNIHQYETQHLPISMRKGKDCTIRIHHLMRNETVRGITELGIKVTSQ